MKFIPALVLLLGALGCGADPTPAPADSGAPGDASSDAPADTGLTLCQSLNRLDCDGDPSQCETPMSESNCGACGRVCPAGSICSTASGRCLQ